MVLLSLAMEIENIRLIDHCDGASVSNHRELTPSSHVNLSKLLPTLAPNRKRSLVLGRNGVQLPEIGFSWSVSRIHGVSRSLPHALS